MNYFHAEPVRRDAASFRLPDKYSRNSG